MPAADVARRQRAVPPTCLSRLLRWCQRHQTSTTTRLSATSSNCPSPSISRKRAATAGSTQRSSRKDREVTSRGREEGCAGSSCPCPQQACHRTQMTPCLVPPPTPCPPATRSTATPASPSTATTTTRTTRARATVLNFYTS
jgi:hypothetical protein